jgi:hypothetical protein
MIGSPTGIMMQDTTFPTFKSLAQQLGFWDQSQVRLSPYPTVELKTGATFRFRTAEDPERMRGPNLSGIWLDEGSLMAREAFNICIACLREGGEQGWLASSFTPAGLNHWTYDVFGKNRPDTEIFHAHTRDNPFAPPGFADTLARQYTEGEARQELAGEFIDADEALQVIPTAWVRAAMDRWRPDGRKLPLSAIGVDVARGGSNKTALAKRYGYWWGLLVKRPGTSTPDGNAVADLIGIELAENRQALVVVDVIGIGAAVYDECCRRRFFVTGCNFGAHTDATDSAGVLRFANIRAFAYWSMREALDPAKGLNVQLPKDDELLADLTAPHWSSTAGGILIEKKEDIAKRLGRSPDTGDAVVYSIVSPR